MNNQLGQQLKLQLFGESHGPYIGVTICGLAAGLRIDKEFITNQLKNRRPQFSFNTSRIEEDNFQIISGIHQDLTTGAPLTILIVNENKQSDDYSRVAGIMRPGHADYPAYIKYGGFNDINGGGVFSGRLTAALTAAGAIAYKILTLKGFLIGTHIHQVGNIVDTYDEINLTSLIKENLYQPFVVYNPAIRKQMEELINDITAKEDSLGAILETNVLNLPVGIGEPFFSGLKGAIAQAIFALPGIKGLEFGCGFSLVNLLGSQFNDGLYYNSSRQVQTKTNYNGGINGGLSNGQSLSFKTAVRPPSSINKVQNTIDVKSLSNITHQITGRHDSFIANRVATVINNVLAFVLLDLCTIQFGRDWMK